MLTNKYFTNIPANSRAAGQSIFLTSAAVTAEKISIARQLDEIAKLRGQTLAQMALAWVLSNKPMTSVIIGASTVSQIIENVRTIDNLAFSEKERLQIDDILADFKE